MLLCNNSNRKTFLQNRNLPVIESDVMAYLNSLADSSVGVITGFHIVEHLPFETLVSLLRETLRVLEPGGLVIFETPNPENVRVGACNFWTDPTHLKPIFPETLKFLLEYQGFVGVELLGLPTGLPDPLQPIENATQMGVHHSLIEQLNTLIAIAKQNFYSSFDFAAIGQKKK